MSINKLTKARAAVGSLIVGSTSGKKNPTTVSPIEISGIYLYSTLITTGAITAGATFTTTFTAAGLLAGDQVDPIPPAALNNGLAFTAWVSAPNVITVQVHNVTVGTITPTASSSWGFLVMKLAPNN